MIVVIKINDFIQLKILDYVEGLDGGFFKLFVDEFSVLEKILFVIDVNLVEIVESLFIEKFIKEKLVEVQNKYFRFENCINLVVFKINK